MTSKPSSYCFGIHPSHGLHVVSGYGWKCTLCDTNLREVDVTAHVMKHYGHRNSILKLAMEQSWAENAFQRRTKVVALESCLVKLEYTKWQLCVKGLLFDHLSTGDSSILQKAENAIDMYEHMERLSLLELAVWKEACISHAGNVELDSKTSILDSKTSMKTLHDALLFTAQHQHTWKKYRTETRKSNAIEMIIKHVLPFLGKP